MIRLDRLTKSFRGLRAVDDVSLEVQAGEIVGLLGPNGAGKSTLLALLLGHVRPDHGTASIRGVSVLRDRARALRGVGAALDAEGFHLHLSGWENLAWLASWSGGAAARELDHAAAFVGLTPRIHDPVRSYSRGMRLRLAIAQALVPQPEIIILDEPFEGLDPEGIHDVRQLIARMRVEGRATIVLASHLLTEVERLCDRAVILQHGRVGFDGPCRDEGPLSLEARYLQTVGRR